VAATHEELLERFLQECGREEPKFLKTSENLFVDKSGFLVYHRSAREHERLGWRGTGSERILLAKYIGHRYKKNGVLLLNGDGFDDEAATRWQTQLRNRGRVLFGERRVILLPFLALAAARIDVDTLRPIEITEDTERTERHTVGLVPEALIAQRGRRLSPRDFEFTHRTLLDARWRPEPGYIPSQGGARYIYHHADNANGETGRIPANSPYPTNRTLGDVLVVLDTGGGHGVYVHQSVRYSALEPNWQTAIWNPTDRRYEWRETYHQLGASVFYANGVDGKRHRFLSAFDQDEPDPMYFLAMLPDAGKCESYQDSLELLKPELVKAAEAQGRRVYRQGDVFAIQTNLTDEEVYRDARTRVRREIALQNPGPNRAWTPAAEGEIVGRGTCPCCESRTARLPFTQEARTALMIYGTGHTATEVVVRNDGATFIRGNMHHDPVLETPGREPEHQVVTLRGWQPDPPEYEGPTREAWYLAVRNTVPRLKADARDMNLAGLELMTPRERRAARARMRRLRTGLRADV
jgi:hypothetical protein